ncbi:MAG: hypothetical protein VCF08_03340 [Alphaproteobacteria bacterium]
MSGGANLSIFLLLCDLNLAKEGIDIFTYITACSESCREACKTVSAEAPVFSAPPLTKTTFRLTSSVPVAASWTLREISFVAAPCCSTAAAMAVAISLIKFITSPIFCDASAKSRTSVVAREASSTALEDVAQAWAT